MQCNATQCKTRQDKRKIPRSHRAEEKTMVFMDGIEERIEIVLVTDTHLLTLLDLARFNENAESRTARYSFHSAIPHSLLFLPLFVFFLFPFLYRRSHRPPHPEIRVSLRNVVRRDVGRREERKAEDHMRDEVELFEVSNYGKEEGEIVIENRRVRCLVITLEDGSSSFEVLDSWLLDRCVLEAFREGFRGNNLTRFQATASKTVKPRIIAVENAEPGGNARPKSCLRAPRVPRNEVAADNDTILCIGYSAHIRGRILHVDLSLSSLLGMHVRRRLAIMRARDLLQELIDFSYKKSVKNRLSHVLFSPWDDSPGSISLYPISILGTKSTGVHHVYGPPEVTQLRRLYKGPPPPGHFTSFKTDFPYFSSSSSSSSSYPYREIGLPGSRRREEGCELGDGGIRKKTRKEIVVVEGLKRASRVYKKINISNKSID
ncbi:hypothetical protein V1478_018401 [Vespula squamosa]|uniref:Uncharacterized protein n=1 Tax=Vespula squamosa TaxID=30214 RepID=A0ABD1ZUX4_VESSQ